MSGQSLSSAISSVHIRLRTRVSSPFNILYLRRGCLRFLSGISLIKKQNHNIATLETERLAHLKSKQFTTLVFLAQGAGAILFGVFLESYAFALPSNRVLHGLPIFKIPISIFGAIFIISTFVLLLLSFKVKHKE